MGKLWGVLILILCTGCIPPPPGAPLPEAPSLAVSREDPRWAEYQAKLEAYQAALGAQGNDLQNALAWAKAAHEEASKPAPQMIGQVAGAVLGQPVGRILAEGAGFLTLLLAYLTNRRRKTLGNA